MKFQIVSIAAVIAIIAVYTPEVSADCVNEGQCKLAGKGQQFTTGPCKADGECQTGCCDGKKCRNPEALKNGETCLTGCTASFNEAGNVGRCVLISAGGKSPAGGEAKKEEQADAKGAKEAKGAGGQEQAGKGGEGKGPACGTVPEGTTCTSSGALILGNAADILKDCEKLHQECLGKNANKGDCDSKLKDCQDKVNVKKDLNPNGPKNTFGG